jgi:hypothetical protein
VNIHDLVNPARTVTVRVPERGELVPAGTQPVEIRTPSAFITAESLVSFPLAAGLVTGLWSLMKVLFPTFGPSPWTAVVVSFAIGLFIYLISITDRRVHLNRSDQLVGLGVAVLNSLYLVMTALGISISPLLSGR